MNHERVKVIVRGAVQGVGFRPFVYRLATELGLPGWVLNSAQGVFIEVDGPRPRLDQFLLRLERDKPPRAMIQSLEFSFLDPAGFERFEIRFSDQAGPKTVLILPDIATCADCLRELFDPANRRHLYPFTNCTNCGPRFTIIESLPYDRPNTSMRSFQMCPECEREYHDPADRRFHAQPNACPACGPQLELWEPDGRVAARRHQALLQAATAVRDGQILALKGVGGFQLIVDARQDAAVARLRERKHREAKPLALMYPGLEAVRADCQVDEFEARLLASPESPIVLLQRRPAPAGLDLAQAVAPGNPHLGVMLPYSPLHHLLLRALGFPVVATSGNLSDEPICIDERDALRRLQGLADRFLVHNRPIVRHVDDSVVRVMLGREMVLRRARGYAPLPISLPRSHTETRHAEPDTRNPVVLAVGAHLKNTVALRIGRDVFLSQHIGDLETPQALAAFRRVAADFERLYEATPETVVCDQHPDYLSTKYAQGLAAPRLQVQHHFAHVLACMAENELEPPVLGVSWDGTGYGLDGTIWGGEFLRVDERRGDAAAGTEPFTRFAHFRNFRLPGGAAAIKQPRRTALGLLWEIFGDRLFDRRDLRPLQHFTEAELGMIHRMLLKGLNAPVTCSVGRLFDAVASLLDLRQRAGFEGQAAMELEFAAEAAAGEETFAVPLGVRPGGEAGPPPARVVDWEPMILELLDGLRRGQSTGLLAAKFHHTLAEVVVGVARQAALPKVVLSGGCFQNKYLTERTVRRLLAEGFRPYWHQRVPTNDGGIALGQAVALGQMQPRPQSQPEEVCLL